MGILNTTPDSFFDGGQHNHVDQAVTHAQAMMKEGAQIIDIGGESTRPGAAKVPADEEAQRTIPVIEKLRKLYSSDEILISIDTSKADVAKAAVMAGADIVNDISAMTFDKNMKNIILEHQPSVILNHIQGTPETMQRNPTYQNVSEDIRDFLKAQAELLIEKGFPRDKICIDPGIGFGKTLDDNLTLIKNLSVFEEINCAILMGMSRKSYIGKTPGLENSDRLIPSITCGVISYLAGASVLRVHDVKETQESLHMLDALSL